MGLGRRFIVDAIAGQTRAFFRLLASLVALASLSFFVVPAYTIRDDGSPASFDRIMLSSDWHDSRTT